MTLFGKITHNSSSCTHGDIGANAHLLDHRGTDADPAAGANVHLTGQASARADVHAISELGVVIDAATVLRIAPVPMEA